MKEPSFLTSSTNARAPDGAAHDPIVHPPVPRFSPPRLEVVQEQRFTTYLISAVVFLVVCSLALVVFVSLTERMDDERAHAQRATLHER